MAKKTRIAKVTKVKVKKSKKSKKSKTKSKSKSSSEKQANIKKHYLTKAPVKRLMKEEGASLISDDALDLLIEKLEKLAVQTTKKALALVKEERRKRVTAEDIAWAAEHRGTI